MSFCSSIFTPNLPFIFFHKIQQYFSLSLYIYF
nr:MAG TPA: hypothetical protein [Caudoviricetes sp.]